MTTWYIGRHEASREWLLQQGIELDGQITHIDGSVWPAAGDVAIGNLPVQLIAELGARQVHYVHIELDLPLSARGTELTAQDLQRYGVKLTPFAAQLAPWPDFFKSIVLS